MCTVVFEVPLLANLRQGAIAVLIAVSVAVIVRAAIIISFLDNLVVVVLVGGLSSKQIIRTVIQLGFVVLLHGGAFLVASLVRVRVFFGLV